MTLTTDIDHVVAAAGELLDQVVRSDHVGAGGVNRSEALLGGPLLDLRRDSVGGEDDRARIDGLQSGEPVGRVDELDSLLLEVGGHVRVVYQLTQHANRLAGRLTDALGDPECVDDPVAVATRRDLDDFHLYEGTNRRSGRGRTHLGARPDGRRPARTTRSRRPTGISGRPWSRTGSPGCSG